MIRCQTDAFLDIFIIKDWFDLWIEKLIGRLRTLKKLLGCLLELNIVMKMQDFTFCNCLEKLGKWAIAMVLEF